MNRIVRIVFQIALLSLISLFGTLVSVYFALPIPGSLIGMVTLFALLCTGIVKVEWFEQGATLLIGELLLFFIPSAIGIIQYTQLFGMTGALLLAVVIISIMAVLISTVGATIWATRFKRKGYQIW